MINTWRPAVYTQKGAGRNWFLDLADLFKEHDEYTKNQLDQLILDPVPDPFAYFIPRSESQIKRRGEREKRRRRKKKEKITRRDSDDPLFVPRGKADKWRRYRVTRHTNTNPKKLHLARSYEAGIRERSNQLLVTQALVFSCCCLVRHFLIPELSYCEAPSLSLSLSPSAPATRRFPSSFTLSSFSSTPSDPSFSSSSIFDVVAVSFTVESAFTYIRGLSQKYPCTFSIDSSSLFRNFPPFVSVIFVPTTTRLVEHQECVSRGKSRDFDDRTNHRLRLQPL